MRLPLLLVLVNILMLSACDLVEVVPPDEPPPVEPPPAQPVHPYGAGNGKVVFLSDLAVAQRIDVTLGGEPIGAVTKFVGCPSRVTADDSLATAIRPAGNYQYSARSTTGTAWATSSVRIDEDGLNRIVLIGRPSAYALHLPSEIEGIPAATQNDDTFHLTTNSSEARLMVTRPQAIQGDRIDVVHNGRVVARGAALGASDLSFDLALTPGPNYVAVRLSHDPDGDGARVNVDLSGGNGVAVRLHNGTDYTFNQTPRPLPSTRWVGKNVRHSC